MTAYVYVPGAHRLLPGPSVTANKLPFGFSKSHFKSVFVAATEISQTRTGEPVEQVHSSLGLLSRRLRGLSKTEVVAVPQGEEVQAHL